jgi:quercetin dioxygenase-like cupin family protein
MTQQMKKNLSAVLVLAAVAGVSYAAGAAKGKPPVIMSMSELKFEPYAPGSPLSAAALWGDRTKSGEYGLLLKMPAGSESGFHSHTADYHAVLVQGSWVHTPEGEASPKVLTPGSFVFQPGKQNHNDQCKAGADCIVLIHQHGKADFTPAKPAKEAAAPAK